VKTETDIQISDLRVSLKGDVISAQHPSYDDRLRVFFTGFDRRPAVIARAADASDVARKAYGEHLGQGPARRETRRT